MNFHDAAEDLKALQNYFENEREAIVDSSLEEGIILCQKWDVATERRRRRIKNMDGEISIDAGLSAIEEMKRVLKETVDRLFQEMNGRFVRLNEIDEKFGFLLDVKGLIYQEKEYDLKKKCNELGQFYVSDIDGNELYEEILDCRMLLTSRKNTISSPETLLEFIVQFGDESVFPNLRVAIQILLTIAVSIASCERSFSKLKLILSYLRATMGEERLCDLALLSVERDETEKTDFDDIINEFASKSTTVIFTKLREQ